jgi:hypothetical protein
MSRKKYVRCAIPDCDWGIPFIGFHRMEDYRDQFRLHCIERHGLSEFDTQAYVHFSLETLLMDLWPDDSPMLNKLLRLFDLV